LQVSCKISLAFVVLIVGAWVSTARATTIVGLVTSTQAFLVADSLRRVQGLAGNTTKTTCKMVATTRAAYSASGLTGTPGSIGEFIDRLVKQEGKDIYSTFDLVEPGIKSDLVRLEPRFDAEHRQRYRSGRPVTQIFAIAALPEPALYQIDFLLSPLGSIESKRKRYYPAVENIVATSGTNGMVEVFNAAPNLRASAGGPDPLAGIRRFMGRVIAADAGNSGFPLSIVRATKAKGIEWVDRGACLK